MVTGKKIWLKAAAAQAILAVLLAASGCCPQRLALSQSIADSLSVQRDIRYVERLRDTVIYVNSPVEVKEVQAQRDSSFLETSLAKSTARIGGDGTLFHTLENKPLKTPVAVTVKDIEQRQTASEGSVRIERVEVPVKVPLTWMQRTLMGCGVAFLALVVVAVTFLSIRWLVRRRR